MRTSHRLSIVGLASVVALVAASPFALSLLRETSSDSSAAPSDYPWGDVALASSKPTLTYPTFPGGGLTITPTMTNSGTGFSWGSFGSKSNYAATTPSSAGYAVSMNYDDWAGGNATNVTFTPTSVWDKGGSTWINRSPGMCALTAAAAGTGSVSDPPTISTCPGNGTSSAPTITYTFSQPVTDWLLSIQDIGGFNTSGGLAGSMYPDWVVTSGQTLAFVSGNNNFQVTGGNTIKLISPPVSQADNGTGAKGVGAGTVKVAGTYTSVTFRLDYYYANYGAVDNLVTSDVPDGQAIQWSSPPTVTLSYDGNGAICSIPSVTTTIATTVPLTGAWGCPRPGYVFTGWNTAANGSGTGYGPGTQWTMLTDTTLYAMWVPAAPTPAGGSGPAPAPAPSSAAPAVPAGPFAVNDSATTQMNVPVSVNAAANDTYPAGSVFTQTSSPANGTVSWNANGSYTYTPNPGFIGIDSFTYKVCMPAPNQGRCASATDFITVGEPNPKANPQTQKVSAGSTRPVMYAPVGLSRPAAGSNLKAGSVAIAPTGTGKWGNRLVVPGKGTWILKGTQVQFVPAPGFTGQTTIRYRIQDRNGKWAYSTLTAVAPAIPTVVTGGR